jgi:hypothetical protein
MTTRQDFAARNRDMQDATERHTHEQASYPEGGAGMYIKVKGNGTEDEEVQVLRIGGVWLHLPKGTNADVYMVAGGADTNQKHAMTDIPRDKHRKTKVGTAGIQHPTDPDLAMEISDKGIRITQGKFAVGENGAFEVKGNDTYVRGDLHIGGVVRANSSGTPNIPAFEPYEGPSE